MNARKAIDRRRAELGLSWAEVARAAGVNADGLRRWIGGRRTTIRSSTLESVAGALGLDLLPCVSAAIARQGLN